MANANHVTVPDGLSRWSWGWCIISVVFMVVGVWLLIRGGERWVRIVVCAYHLALSIYFAIGGWAIKRLRVLISEKGVERVGPMWAWGWFVPKFNYTWNEIVKIRVTRAGEKSLIVRFQSDNRACVKVVVELELLMRCTALRRVANEPAKAYPELNGLFNSLKGD